MHDATSVLQAVIDEFFFKGALSQVTHLSNFGLIFEVCQFQSISVISCQSFSVVLNMFSQQLKCYLYCYFLHRLFCLLLMILLVEQTVSKLLFYASTTLVPEVFLDFSPYERANTKRQTHFATCVQRFAALSQLSHALKNEEKPLGSGYASTGLKAILYFTKKTYL